MDETIKNTAETSNDNRADAQNVGVKTLKATPEAEALVSESVDDKLDPFWEQHPNLLSEAKELGAPLTASSFFEQGFIIFDTNHEKDSDQELHVFAPSPEYKKYLESGGDPKKWFDGPDCYRSDYLEYLDSGLDPKEWVGPKYVHRYENVYDRNQRIREEEKRLEREREEIEKRQREEEERAERVERERMEAEKKFQSLNEDELAESKDKMYQRLQNDFFFGHGTIHRDTLWVDGTRQVIDENGRIGKNAFDRLLVENDRDMAKSFLLNIISIGAEDSYDWNGFGYQKETAYFMPGKYYVERLDKALENYGVDVEGEGEYKRALVGFVNTLSGVNGEKTDQAQWYFETFRFAGNWDRFLGAMAVASEKRGIGFKRKLTMFLKTLAEWSERNDKIKAEKEARKLASKNDFARLGNMREVSKDYIDAYVDTLREDANLDGNYFPVKDMLQKRTNEGTSSEAANNGENTVNDETINSKPDNLRNDDPEYGKMKIVKLGDWCDYIQRDVDPNAKFYIESIGAGDKRVRGEYLAIQFTIDDKTYCIAESIRDNAAMYLASGEAGEDIREYFRTLSKREARKDDHISVIYHLDKENFGDSLDQCYAKAFFLLFGGKKSQKDFGKTQVFPVGEGFNESAAEA